MVSDSEGKGLVPGHSGTQEDIPILPVRVMKFPCMPQSCEAGSAQAGSLLSGYCSPIPRICSSAWNTAVLMSLPQEKLPHAITLASISALQSQCCLEVFAMPAVFISMCEPRGFHAFSAGGKVPDWLPEAIVGARNIPSLGPWLSLLCPASDLSKSPHTASWTHQSF